MLEIANLSHTYANGTVALDDVSLSNFLFGLIVGFLFTHRPRTTAQA